MCDPSAKTDIVFWIFVEVGSARVEVDALSSPCLFCRGKKIRHRAGTGAQSRASRREASIAIDQGIRHGRSRPGERRTDGAHDDTGTGAPSAASSRRRKSGACAGVAAAAATSSTLPVRCSPKSPPYVPSATAATSCPPLDRARGGLANRPPRARRNKLVCVQHFVYLSLGRSPERT